MRVWLVDDRRGDNPGSLEALLSQLGNRPDSGFRLLGAKPFGTDFVSEMRLQQPDVLVIHEPAWPDDAAALDLLGFEPTLVVATTPERSARFHSLAERHSVWFIPPLPSLDCLRLALLGAFAAQHRQAQWRAQLARLQQRLSDRIIIERAKGIMVQRLGISEEEAYKRLRLLSRRQRRQIRDIAQSLLDTQFLLLPESNGLAEPTNGEPRRTTPQESPPS
jgi:AmiR/NasT family two-component response regulator